MHQDLFVYVTRRNFQFSLILVTLFDKSSTTPAPTGIKIFASACWRAFEEVMYLHLFLNVIGPKHRH